MNIQGYHIPIEIVYILGIIFGFLLICSTIFGILNFTKPTPFKRELVIRTRSWWFIAIGIGIVITAPKIIGILILAYVSFVALRETMSIAVFREDDRTALFIAYFAIPGQYYLAYHNLYTEFLFFIPLVMFIAIPFLLVVRGITTKIGRSMAYIPSILILTVYMPSHIALLFNLEIPGYEIGAGGLIIYLIMLTSFNDVFQFTWGKLLGKRKILPTVSPNKTWAGFVGGTLTTAALGFGLQFLTPFTALQSTIMGLVIGLSGFIGDSLISALKRDLKIKDTDDLIPGHGGAMDRLDSILISAPVFYHLLTYFINNG